MKFRVPSLTVIALLLAMLLSSASTYSRSAAQGGTPASTVAATLAGLINTGFFRLVHASPDSGPVDIYLDGSSKVALPALAYKEYMKSFVELPTRKYSIQVRKAGAPAADQPLFSGEFELQSNKGVTVVLIGKPGAEKPDGLQVVSFTTDLANIGDKARVEAFNALVGSKGLSFDLQEAKSAEPVTLKGLDFGQSAAQDVSAGTYDISAYTTDPKTPQVTLIGLDLRPTSLTSLIAITEGKNTVLLALTTTNVVFAASQLVATPIPVILPSPSPTPAS